MIKNTLTSFKTSNTPSSVTHLKQTSWSSLVDIDSAESLHILVIEWDCEVDLLYNTSVVWATTVVKCLCLATTDVHIKLTLNGQVQHDDTAVDLHVVTLFGEGGSAQIDGKVSLMPWWVKMHGELLEENIILGKQVTIKTLPMLDVHTNDVTAAHGARIEKLNSKKLFYLKSRGLNEQQATQMMIGGYIESIFEWVEQNDEIKALKTHAFQTILASL